MNYQKFKRLLEGEVPSVAKFKAKTMNLSSEERQQWLYMAFDTALHEWSELSSKYKRFLVNLIKSERQSFLDYIRQETILGELLFKPDNPVLLRKIAWLLEGGVKENKSSSWDLTFSLLLAFDLNLKLSSLHQYMRTDTFTTDDMVELLEITEIV